MNSLASSRFLDNVNEPVIEKGRRRVIYERDCFDRLCGRLLFSVNPIRHKDDRRRIQPAAQLRPDWKVRTQPARDRFAKQFKETLADACSAVNRACTWHPKRSLCLQRASVLVCLLRSLGFQAEMVIGVHKMPFYGHAWAEVGGEVVNDHANAQKFFHVLSRC